MTGTIYVIRNRQSSKEFVGATTLPLSHIWTAHKSFASRNRRTPLHDEIRKLGPQNFLIMSLETVPIDKLRPKQQEWIDRLKCTVPWGYNRLNRNSGHRVHFTARDVKQIIKMSETISQKSIAQKFGVSQATISRIVNRKIYK